MPKGERELPSHKIVPSPDAYTPALNQFKKAFSFGHKYMPIITSDYYDPGPGGTYYLINKLTILNFLILQLQKKLKC